LIVAGIHLTCGLTDGSVAANKNQLNNLTNYLAQHHHGQPWIIAGDFNLTTSTYTINTALTNKYISTQTTVTLASMERALSDLGLLDAWAVARIEAADDLSGDAVEALYHGEEGATFDLRNNSLAPATSGTSNNRPQRYDRILARPQNMLQNVHFNRFGFPQEIDGVPVVASDHLGVRVTMKLLDGIIDKNELESDMMRTFNMQCKRATEDMADISSLSAALSIHRLFMSEEEVQHRRQAFQVLKQVILGTSNDDDSGLPEIPMVLVAVGSYALGVDTLESDIDCLCIGAISSKTFFKLARQRLVKAESRGIRILRKVEANTGTMLELSINGIAMDLQYCPAARVVER
jgi:endonuclease/exonuclease/phosphatase family metal-dependent hydrolase